MIHGSASATPPVKAPLGTQSTSQSTWRGGCHCGAVRLAWATALPLDALAVRRCTCSYCRAQGARYASDPESTLHIAIRQDATLVRYRMGPSSAVFLSCGHCGVYIGACLPDDGRVVLNLNTLDQSAQCPLGEPVDFSGETPADRRSRQLTRWSALRWIGPAPFGAKP